VEDGEVSMDEKISIIAEAIRSGGYDVRAQLTGYLQSGDETYITRRNNARELISALDKDLIKAFVDSLPEE